MPEDPAPLADLLRRALQATLPEHMVPAAFVPLERLPLNANGKLDRAALPVPQAARGPFVAPRNGVETVLAEIWQELLKVERVGVEDDFFDLGGHSLIATQVASRVYEAFRIELPLLTLFEARTVANLAQALLQQEPRPGQLEKMAAVFLRLRNLSPEEKQKMLAARRGGEGVG